MVKFVPLQFLPRPHYEISTLTSKNNEIYFLPHSPDAFAGIGYRCVHYLAIHTPQREACASFLQYALGTVARDVAGACGDTRGGVRFHGLLGLDNEEGSRRGTRLSRFGLQSDQCQVSVQSHLPPSLRGDGVERTLTFEARKRSFRTLP